MADFFGRCHYLHLHGLVAGSNGVRRRAVPFLHVPVRATAVGGPILPIAGRVR